MNLKLGKKKNGGARCEKKEKPPYSVGKLQRPPIITLFYSRKSNTFVDTIHTKLFRISDVSVIKYRQEMFHFELTSITLLIRLGKNEIEHCTFENVLIKFVF